MSHTDELRQAGVATLIQIKSSSKQKRLPETDIQYIKIKGQSTMKI